MAGSTPIYGFPYPQSTDLVADYPALGQDLATDVETVISGLGSGLNLITPTSIANSGGSASASGGAITFTGASSVSLNGVFSSTYDIYRVTVQLTASSTTNQLCIRMRTGGTDNSSANYYYNGYQLASASASTVAAFRSAGAQNRFPLGDINGGTASSFEIFGPFGTAAYTRYNSTTTGSFTTDITVQGVAGGMSVNTSYDSFSLFVDVGTMTGKVRVYGYKNQ